MTSHNERFRSRASLMQPNFKFPGFQGLCLSGVDSSYLSSAMGSPAVMVLTSTGGDVVSPHVPGQVSFARQRMDKDGTSNHVPFPSPSFPVRPLFGQGDPYGPLSSPLLSLHHPLLASHSLSRSYLNAAASGAFRPLGIPEDRNGFHGSAFMPAKCLKMEQSPTDLTSPQHLLIPPCFQSGDSGSFQSPANSHTSTGSLHGGSGLSSFLDVKDEDHRDSDSLADGPDRLTETPISDGSRSIERTTPDDRGTPKRHKKFFLEGQTPYCPICGTSLQLSELSSHFEMEIERLMEMSKCISQQMDTSPLRSPFSSPLARKDGHEKGKPESRWETYQRVKINRQNRLGTRACTSKRKKWEESPSPGRSDRGQEEVTHMMLPGIRKRDGPEMETERPADSHNTVEQFSWAVSARLHAIAQLQRGLAESYTRKFEGAEEENQELNVDGDDSATYGQPHYTEADVITCSTEDNTENKESLNSITVTESSTFQRLSESSQWNSNGTGTNGEGQEVTSTCVNNIDAGGEFSPSDKTQKVAKENGEVSKDPEHNEDGIKCLICMEPFIKPVVSICCWHVHCEECWLKTLGTKKLCPQCNMITCVRDLRRIFL